MRTNTFSSKKKVAFVYNVDMSKRFANVNSALQNICALSNLGHDVTLVTRSQNKSKRDQLKDIKDACEFYGLAFNFKVIIIKGFFLGGVGKGLVMRLNSLIMAVIIKRMNPDIVWSRHIFPVFFCVKFKLPTVFEHHTLLSSGIETQIERIKSNKFFLKFLAISDKHKDIIKNTISEEKIIPVHSGIDLKNIEKLFTHKENSNHPVIIYAGSFYKGRGIKQVIACARHLPQYDFWCIGASKKDFIDYQKELKELDNLSFYKRMPRRELIKELYKADCLLAPYTSECETIDGVKTIEYASPMKVIEYLSIGKPIIATNIGAIPEIIQDRYNGILIVENDIEALVSALDLIIKDIDFQKKLSKNAKESVCRFSWENRVKKVLDEVFP